MKPEDAARAIAEAHADAPGALMPVLVDVNRALGHVPAAVFPVIAGVLNISEADVAGAASFYSDFRSAAPGRTVVKVCRAEACQAAGGEALAAHAETRLGCGFGETSDDVTLEAIYCFGNCALAPAAEVDGRLIGRVTPAALDKALGR